MGAAGAILCACAFPALLFLIAFMVWLIDRERNPRPRIYPAEPSRRFCMKCGYDLTGNESGVPECGTERDPV
jgi:hypothetical protein